MTDLSSCYFCGTALDAPIEAVPVVPERLDAADDTAIDLCPTCRRKVSKVLDTVLAAAEDRSVDVQPTAAPDPDTDDAAGDGPGDQATTSTEDATDAGAIPETVGEPDADSGPDGDETDPDGTGPAGQESEAAPEDEATATDDDAAEAERDERADAAAGGESAEPSLLSTPTAKKVVRLLQNREFPVDRAEFRTVAASAYQLPEQDCEDVLDELVAQGYVAEDGDRLVRPEE
ncbi:MAG: hypothetical protein ABEJ31_09065 [Haloarculaceae archaeon]